VAKKTRRNPRTLHITKNLFGEDDEDDIEYDDDMEEDLSNVKTISDLRNLRKKIPPQKKINIPPSKKKSVPPKRSKYFDKDYNLVPAKKDAVQPGKTKIKAKRLTPAPAYQPQGIFIRGGQQVDAPDIRYQANRRLIARYQTNINALYGDYKAKQILREQPVESREAWLTRNQFMDFSPIPKDPTRALIDRHIKMVPIPKNYNKYV
jgi:hypothetical protein